MTLILAAAQSNSSAVSSAVFELMILSLPSLVYGRRLRRAGRSDGSALTAVGLQWGPPASYAVALGLVVPVAALAAIMLHVIPSGILHGHSKNIVGAPTTAAGYLALVLLALAEEMFFRGWLAGLLFRRFGFAVGNSVQALVFLAPHLLLLLVSVSLWPILPLQLAAGWTLGWLRWRSGSIGPCWLAHALTNVLPALLFGL